MKKTGKFKTHFFFAKIGKIEKTLFFSILNGREEGQIFDSYLQVSNSSTFFARFFCTNVIFGSFSSYILALAPKFCTKNLRVNVDEIDGRFGIMV